MKRLLALLAATCLMSATLARAEDAAPASAGPAIEGLRRVPMRDGGELTATVYKPARSGRWPTIVLISPYGRSIRAPMGMKYAAAGFVLVVLDTRGRGDAPGEAEPFEHEATDTYDAIEWAAAQPFSDGQVAMTGSSYGGFAQWAAAKGKPPHLKAIEPSAAVFPGWDFPMWRNVGYPYMASWTAYTYGHISNAELFGDQAFWSRNYEEALRGDVPFSQLDSYVGFPSKVFQTWAAHPSYDAYWAGLNPTSAEFAGIDLPILSVTGLFDGAQMGALEYYKRHMAAASPAARAKHYLVIGPFDHSGTRFPAASVGGVAIAPAGVIDMTALDLAYYDWTLRGGPRPAFLKDHVAYWVMGADEWRYAPSLDATGASPVVQHLAATSGQATAFGKPGPLQTRAPAPGTAAYRYDPKDLSKTDRQGLFRGAYLTNDAFVRRIDGNGLIYETEPYAKGVEIIGKPRLSLWAAVDAPDTDIKAELYEVKKDGSSLWLSTDRIRARYRNSPSEPSLLKPGKVELYDFNQFIWTARRLAPGSRIRLVISAPDAIQTQRNGDTGGAVAEEKLSESRATVVTVHQGGRYDSRLTLPSKAP